MVNKVYIQVSHITYYMSDITHIKIKKNDLSRIRALKVHDRQADHEIVQFLLDTHDKYVHIMDKQEI